MHVNRIDAYILIMMFVVQAKPLQESVKDSTPLLVE